MKNIHCEVQVILLQKSWYVMKGIDWLVMYCMKVQARTNMKNIQNGVQLILLQKFWFEMRGSARVVFHEKATRRSSGM